MSEAEVFNLHPAQSLIAKDQHRYRVICAGRRFGKSVLVSWEMLAIAVSCKEARVPYYAPTRDDARDIMWGMLKKVCEPVIIDVNESRLEITVKNQFGGSSLLVLYGWEAVQDRGKGVGLKNNHIFFDEVSKYRDFFRGWEEILSPTLLDLKGGATFISTPNGFNHFKALFDYENDPEINAKDEWKSFHFTSYDNPFLDPEEIDVKRNLISEDRFAQEYLADFRKMEGLVYKEFSREKHVTKELPSLVVEKLGGVDFGFRDPAAVPTIKKDYNGVYWIVDEWFHTGKTEEEVADYVAAQKFSKVFPDPENASAIELLRRKGVNVREVSKGKGSVIGGIDIVRELLKQDRLKVHVSCKHTIEAFEMYSYPPDSKTSQQGKELPDHAFSDMCFEGNTIVDGRKIKDIGICTGVKDVYEYEIAGEKIIATPNHKIVTQRGLTAIDTLRYNDCIWKKKSLFMQVNGGPVTQKLLKVAIAITSVVIRRELESRELHFIDSSGKKLTELSRKDFIFITLMAIPTIIRWTILSVLALANTYINTLQKKDETKQKSILKTLFKKHQNGPRQKKDKSLDRNGEKEIPCIYHDINSNACATCVEKNISVKNQEEDSAITIANKKRYVGLVPVYNLRTKSGMYHANNLLVSNCDAIRYILMSDYVSKSSAPTVHYSNQGHYGRRTVNFAKF